MENKKTNQKVASNNPNAQRTDNNQPPQKGGKTCLTCGIIAAVVVVLIIVGFVGLHILSFWFPPYALFGLFGKLGGGKNVSRLIGPGPGKAFFGKKQPVPDMAKAVKKMITAKDGGTIELAAEDGVTVTVVIPPGSLEEDTEVVVAPNESDPDDENGADSPEDPGVTVGPPGTTFDPPATIVFSFIPTQTTASVAAGAGSSGSRPGASGSSERDGNRDSGRRFPGSSVIVYTNNGTASPVPTTREDDGATISGSISGSGAAEPENPTEDEAEGMVESAAAASGGACTGEYIEALARMVAVAGADGNSAVVSRYESEIRRCNDESLDHLKYLCEHDPVRLRRKDFRDRLALAQALPASSGTASEIERLMNECQARYHFHGEAIHPQSTAGVTMFSSLDATVCGYLDDQWTGTQIYQLRAEYNTAHNFEGTAEFNLPPNAGSFSASSRGTNDMTVVGRGVAIPNFVFGFDGYFDGNATIQTLNLYPGTVASGIPIELQEKSCVPAVPLAP